MVATERNILDVFTTVTSNLDTKIDALHQKEISSLTEIEVNIARIQKEIKSKEEYNRTLPKAIAIDLSLDTSVLNSELAKQHRLKKLRENYFAFVQEKESLKIAFAPINALVLNKQVFHDLTDYFGLVRLYDPNNKEDIYCVAGNHESSFRNYQKLVDNAEKTYESKIWDYKNALSDIERKRKTTVRKSYLVSGIVGLLAYYFTTIPDFQTFLVEGVGLSFLEISAYTVFFIAALSFLAFKVAHFFMKDVSPVPKEPLKETIKPYIQTLFPNNEVRSINNLTGYGTWTYFKLSLPTPPEHIRKNIISALNLYKGMMKGELCTVADPNALKIELERVHHKPEPIPPRPADPGIVIEYEHFAVILPETFYNITNLESDFMNEAVKIAEKWDAKKYLLN